MREYRICSFSKEYNNILLWAHYADGFKGICIKVEIDEKWPGYEIVEINYNYDVFKPAMNPE